MGSPSVLGPAQTQERPPRRGAVSLAPSAPTPRPGVAHSRLHVQHPIPILNASKCHYTFLRKK